MGWHRRALDFSNDFRVPVLSSRACHGARGLPLHQAAPGPVLPETVVVPKTDMAPTVFGAPASTCDFGALPCWRRARLAPILCQASFLCTNRKASQSVTDKSWTTSLRWHCFSRWRAPPGGILRGPATSLSKKIPMTRESWTARIGQGKEVPPPRPFPMRGGRLCTRRYAGPRCGCWRRRSSG